MISFLTIPSYLGEYASELSKSPVDKNVQRRVQTSQLPHPIFTIHEILEQIIHHVHYQDLSIASQVCKSWYHLATPRLLRHVCFHGQDSYSSILKFTQSMDWSIQKIKWTAFGSVPVAEKKYGRDDIVLVNQSDLLRATRNKAHRILHQAKNQKISSASNALTFISSQLFAGLGQRQNRGGECKKICQMCHHSRLLSEQSPVKEMLIPNDLGKYSHRFKGAVYGVVSLKATKKFKDQAQVKALTSCSPCIQVHIHPTLTKWNVFKSSIHQTNGPFLKSLTISNVDITDQTMCLILSKTKNLTFLSISNCPLISDKTVQVASETVTTRLTHITLVNLPLLTDTGLHHLARNCINLEGVDLTNSTNISESGIKDILSMCPFLTLLDLQRLGLGSGYAINEKIVPYILAYGISLRYLSVAGCALRSHDIERLVHLMPNISTWGVGFMQVGSRNMALIRRVVSGWTRSDCASLVPLGDTAITMTFPACKKKIHLIGTREDRVSRYFSLSPNLEG